MSRLLPTEDVMVKDWTEAKTKYKRPRAASNTPAAKYARRFLNAVMTEVEVDEYAPKLRVSKLPSCGLLEAIERIEKPVKPIPYSMAFYTSVGTAVHSTIQQRAAGSRRVGHMMYGEWLCDDPSCKHKLPRQIRPDSLICPKCKSGKLLYEELSFNYKGITGHLDMLTMDDRKGRKRRKRRRPLVVAWEFKTTGEYNIANPDRYLPYDKHKMQIETYCHLLNDHFNIKVDYCFIVYISRNKTQMLDAKDNIVLTEDFDAVFNVSDDTHEEQYVAFPFKVTSSMIEVRKAELDKLAESDALIKRLFAKPTEKNLARLEDNRACFKPDDYKSSTTGMVHAFFKSDCPFLSKGLCFQKGRRTEAGIKLARLLGINST